MGARLVRAFLRITDPRVRLAIIRMVEKMESAPADCQVPAIRPASSAFRTSPARLPHPTISTYLLIAIPPHSLWSGPLLSRVTSLGRCQVKLDDFHHRGVVRVPHLSLELLDAVALPPHTAAAETGRMG